MHLYQDPLWREGSVNPLQRLQFSLFWKVQMQGESDIQVFNSSERLTKWYWYNTAASFVPSLCWLGCFHHEGRIIQETHMSLPTSCQCHGTGIEQGGMNPHFFLLYPYNRSFQCFLRLAAWACVFEDCQGLSRYLFKGKTYVVYSCFTCSCAKSLMKASVLKLAELSRTFHLGLTLKDIYSAVSCLSLFQCPRINGIKAYTKEIGRRQVTLDLQIW